MKQLLNRKHPAALQVFETTDPDVRVHRGILYVLQMVWFR